MGTRKVKGLFDEREYRNRLPVEDPLEFDSGYTLGTTLVDTGIRECEIL